jgi:phage tail-like protein
MSKDRKHHKHGSLRVSWDGAAVPGVDRLSPLVQTVEVITVRNPGSGGTRTVPGRIDSGPVTLERPVGGDTAFEQWAELAGSSGSSGLHKDVTVEVLDSEGGVLLTYRIRGCWPIEYRVALLGPGTRAAAVEQLRLENDGWDRV